MLNISELIKQWKTQRKQKKLLNKPIRSLARFKQQYPEYTIGANCYGIPVVKHQHPNAGLKIGSYCSFAKNVQIFLGGNHRTDWVSTYPFPAFFEFAQHIANSTSTRGDVIIGNDVWLCENCTILSGVSIGDGAVVANGAMVTKDVAPYEVVGGNPAKHIRWRFDEATRHALLASAWWNWPQDEVLTVVDLICSDDINGFLNYVKSRKP